MFYFSVSTAQEPHVASFGPKGVFIIQETLKQFDTNDEQAENNLHTTLSLLVDRPQIWDKCDDNGNSNFMSTRKFSKFILIPHIAASLISQDLEISLRDAVEILEDSRPYGLLFNADLPEKVDIVVPSNDAPSQPPRHRKKPVVNLKVSI